jgi:hypothetical protein
MLRYSRTLLFFAHAKTLIYHQLRRLGRDDLWLCSKNLFKSTYSSGNTLSPESSKTSSNNLKDEYCGPFCALSSSSWLWTWWDIWDSYVTGSDKISTSNASTKFADAGFELESSVRSRDSLLSSVISIYCSGSWFVCCCCLGDFALGFGGGISEKTERTRFTNLLDSFLVREAGALVGEVINYIILYEYSLQRFPP